MPAGERSLPAPASHGTCFSWTTYTYPDGHVYIPSTSRESGQTHCLLVEGNRTEGVYKLQRALDLCAQPRQSVTVDGISGSQTTAAVKRT